MDLRIQTVLALLLLLLMGPAWFFGSFLGPVVLIFVVLTGIILFHLCKGE